MTEKHVDDVSGVETTGHEWDGIRELNNPMPRWWLWAYYATIVWGLAYVIAYPAWPLISTATEGVLGWTSRGAFAEEQKVALSAQAELNAQIAEKSVEEILADENLYRFAVSAGSAAFKVNCVQCHGSGAQGSPGYPNLNDDDWIWGGSIDAIHTTIAYGVRDVNYDDTRLSDMPPFGDMLTNDEIRQVAAYVGSISRTPAVAEQANVELAKAGEALYADNCAACHAADGTGEQELGAPNLIDAIWLYGSSQTEIATQIRNPKHGVMPGWEKRLGDVTSKQLAVYVYSLGGGE